MLRVFLFIAILYSSVLSAQSNNNKVKVHDALMAFIPSGWRAIALADGDLNKDKLSDAVLVVEEENPAKHIPNTEGTEPEKFNTNPRRLLILFAAPGGKYKVAADKAGLIPSEHDPEIPCLLDPFLEGGGISIKNGTLLLRLQSFMSCGSWALSNDTYTFSYRNDRFELIGYDIFEGNRATGELTETSLNFLTKKKKVTTGGNLFEDESVTNKPVETWSAINLQKIYSLENLQRDTEIDINQ
ncbi:MAG: hypothetical protein ACO1N9_09850 [Flavobacterium sp.]